jgi:predicted subunit of tRNA(5-methylaminomethyl-2-thiouridylate) methyltransferase
MFELELVHTDMKFYHEEILNKVKNDKLKLILQSIRNDELTKLIDSIDIENLKFKEGMNYILPRNCNFPLDTVRGA